MAELERIADPENQSPSADALEARNLVKELNYNKDENVFMVKTVFLLIIKNTIRIRDMVLSALMLRVKL